MTLEGKTLFNIYEYLRAKHYNILRLHHRYIETNYIAHHRKAKRIRLKKPPPSDPTPDPTPPVSPEEEEEEAQPRSNHYLSHVTTQEEY